ncbi:MAG: hypothetical protein IMW91_11025, partial [Firmicutes bacterium]|nr:hypothetical protein [Bacillota bacterium]
LSAGAVAGQKIHPLLLTNGSSLSADQVSWLKAQKGKIHSLAFVGGVLSAQLQIVVQDALATP